MTTYRITWRDSHNKEHCMPIISTNAVKACSDLMLLGYDLKKVVHSYPAQ